MAFQFKINLRLRGTISVVRLYTDKGLSARNGHQCEWRIKNRSGLVV